MSSGQNEEYTYINRPVPKEHKFEYQPPPAASNPVLRGLPLYYLAQLVVKSSLVQRILWSLNGFGKLRDRPELEDVEPRYLPNVIKALSGGAKPLRQGEYLATLNAEDWSVKAPKGKVSRSVLEYHEAYKGGELTPVDVVEALLPLVGRDGDRGKHATAFLCVRAEMVRKAAEESAERWRQGEPRSLIDGVVMAVKDEEDLTGHTRSLGSKLDFRHREDATSYCVQKWMDAGAICLGKTTMHEMGMDTTNNNPNHGTPLNPFNERYYCGGSSGGSAYSVGAGLVAFAMGNDGGGSVRIPASYCGLYGLKPSHGRISVRPTANAARSTGVAGPIAANMVDLEIAYRVMAEPDRLDPDSALFAPPRGVEGGKKALGICRPWLDRADKDVREVCWKAIRYLEQKCGYEVVVIDLPLLHEGQLMHALTIMSEILSGCSPSTLSQLIPPNQILLSIASQTRGVDFLQAQKLRNLQMQHLAYLWEKHPGMVIVTPTTPNPGWPHLPSDLNPHGVSDGNMQIRNMEYAYLANFTGCPALSAPVGYLKPSAGDGQVPIGLMGMGEWGSEDELMGFGYDVEKFLYEGLEGGRVMPGEGRCEDVFEVVRRRG